MKQFGDFYIQMVCGYKMIKMQKEGQRDGQVDVPLSFQSCMEGIMLAAEIVIESHGLDMKNIGDISQYQVLEVYNENNPTHESRLKNYGGKCICGDQDYQEVYRLKWES